MKLKHVYCLLAFSVVAMVSSLPFAQASSIQIMPPSTSKIEMIGSVRKTTPKPMAKKSPKKAKMASEPEIQAKPVAAKTTTPHAPAMPQMRTGEIELPIVQVNETKSGK